ncbi:hypothetical protein EV643_1224 [Kribbella sp. VKM Ac-2527]|uniref:Uncharacterized protein n=1 Tax=Kribbella caucasensis TaxID=2512215 RepID=A0A4R6JHN9_9ACTN|nr:hypothetical protein [Kribbella sp. VKM Ac-2527]TDO35593.1 hypothetical protein EV643_1224 [Kribbella sp. VKM Ac-2527]
MTEHPGEQVPPAFDPDVEPGFGPEPDEHTPDYDTEPEPESTYDEPPADDFPGDSPTDQASYGDPAGDAAYGEAVEERVGEGAHPLVEETMARLDGLRERPVGEHAEVYADLHERLQNALVEADAESGDRN